MIEKDNLLIRQMTKDDFDIMVNWLNDKEVLEFYDELPSNLDRVKEKYGPRITGNHYVTPCIVEYKNQPLGYIQYYEIQEDDLKKYGYDSKQNIYGIDQFIGKPEMWGRGIGTLMVGLMLNFLQSKGAEKVVLDVRNNNIRAIKSYEKCGFKKIKKLNNELDLMEFDSSSELSK